MMQTGLFDCQQRFDQLDKAGDPLIQLNAIIDWEAFRPSLEMLRQKERKSTAGRKPYDAVLMFKITVLRSLYNLAFEAIEFQIRDRLSFMRFLGLTLSDRVPDEKSIWLFEDQLAKAGLVETLFNQFNVFLRDNGFAARKGQIVDASIVAVPRQRNSRDENAQIKNGETPEDWPENKRCQKDTDARWTKKNGKNYYGYKNHVSVDVKDKFVRAFEVTPASVHDSQVFEELLDEKNSSKDVWADSAYRSESSLKMLTEGGFREHVQRKGTRHRKLSAREQRGNRSRSKTRSRVEHVFGVQTMMIGDMVIRAIGKIRVRAMIGMRNLVYNLNRYRLLAVTA